MKTRVTAGASVAEQQVATINDLGATNEKLQTQIKTFNEQLAAQRAVGDTAAALRSELDDVKAKLADAQKAAGQQSASVAELTSTNEKLAGEMKDLQAQLATLRTENGKLADSEQARHAAEQRAAALTTASADLAAAQRDLANVRAENTRLNDTLQATGRDRDARLAQLQQENAAINARLRQAQGTLDSIASAARLINGGMLPAAVAPLSTPTAPITAAPAPAPAQPRVHVVQEGDSLTRISVRYYGTGSRWQEIYDANRDTLKGENALRPGQRLKIP